MADFEAVLRKTLDGMTDPSPEARAKVYERARATINRQIDAMAKRPSDEAIKRQFEKLEAAIADIESKYAAPPPTPPEPDEPSADSDLDHLFETGVIPARQEAPAEKPAEAPAPVEPEKPAEADKPAKAEGPAPEPETPAPAPAPEPPAASSPSSEDDKDDPLAAFLAEQEAAASGEEIAFEARGEGRERMGAPVSAGRSRLMWIGIAVAVVLVAGVAAFFGRDSVASLFGTSETQTVEDGVPVREAPSTTISADDTDTSGGTADAGNGGEEIAAVEGPEKFTQRLTPDGSEVDEGPAQAGDATGEGTSVAGQTEGTAPPPDAQAASDGETPADDAEASGEPASLPVGQRAIFYQERTGSQAGTAESGAAIWSVVQESPGGDAPLEPAIRAEASIPELGLTMEMTIRRNADDTFPASHVIELLFRVPDTFEGRGIADVQRITFKGTEQDPGNALIGVAAPLDTNIFLIALTDAQTAIETNLNLMRREEWIDIPMQYISGRRALITLEKGIPGEQVFNEVLSAWEEAGPPAE